MTSTLTALTIHEANERLTKREISSVELTQAYLDAITARDKHFGCYLTRCDELALKAAEDADQQRQKNNTATPLTGIPLALKDIFLTRGVRTTCGSRMLDNYIPPYNGTVVEKLNAAGAVLLGKLNMDEFAMGSSNEHSAFGPVKNPWKLDCVPGGSSGGSAAAVAADLCVASLGTDTGGSIRQPAAFCNIVGLKPTYGRVSRYGIVAFASSLDQLGPMTRDVEDCAILLQAIAGHDPRDDTSARTAVPDYRADLKRGIAGLTLGVPKEYFVSGIDPEVEKAVQTATDLLTKAGAKIHEISLPHTSSAVPCYYIIAPAEASSNLARYDGIRYGSRSQANDLRELYEKTRTEGFGPEVTLRIIIGTYVLSSGYYDSYYLKAQKVRTLISEDFKSAFQHVDAIVCPTTPSPAFRLGELIDDPIKMYLNDILTIPVNLAGLPAMSIPCGFTKEHLPIGLQLIGRAFDEATLLRIAWTYEQATDWHTKKPPHAYRPTGQSDRKAEAG